jgi:hypothetical protein
MLNFRLIKVRFFHDFVTFVAKNVLKNVFKSQNKFNKTNHFRSAYIWHFEYNAKNVFWKTISYFVNRNSDKKNWINEIQTTRNISFETTFNWMQNTLFDAMSALRKMSICVLTMTRCSFESTTFTSKSTWKLFFAFRICVF